MSYGNGVFLNLPHGLPLWVPAKECLAVEQGDPAFIKFGGSYVPAATTAVRRYC